MLSASSLTVDQRAAAIGLFNDGMAGKAAAARLGVSVWAVDRLYDRWPVCGSAGLVREPTKRSLSFEFKREVAQRFLAGEAQLDLAREFDLSSPNPVRNWVRVYRREGEDGLRPKRRGRLPKPAEAGGACWPTRVRPVGVPQRRLP